MAADRSTWTLRGSSIPTPASSATSTTSPIRIFLSMRMEMPPRDVILRWGGRETAYRTTEAAGRTSRERRRWGNDSALLELFDEPAVLFDQVLRTAAGDPIAQDPGPIQEPGGGKGAQADFLHVTVIQ